MTRTSSFFINDRRRRQPEGDGEVATAGCYPPFKVFNDYMLLHYGFVIKRFTNDCLFYLKIMSPASIHSLVPVMSHALLSPA
jgi:hypothetical protein